MKRTSKIETLVRIILSACAAAGIWALVKADAAEPKKLGVEKTDITGEWNLPGYYCENPTNNVREYWGWGTYNITNNQGKVSGSFKSESYDLGYKVEGTQEGKKVILKTSRADGVNSNSWIYRGVLSDDNTIFIGPGAFPELRKLHRKNKKVL